MPDFELIIVSVKCYFGSNVNGPDFCVALFYRPPSSNYSILDTLFTTLCSIFISLPSQFVLMGDFNINFFNTSPLYFKLLSVVSSFNLSQIVTEATRVTNTTSSLIDLIFVSSSVNVVSCTIPPLSNADHYGLHLIVTTQSCGIRSKRVIRKIWRYDLVGNGAAGHC